MYFINVCYYLLGQDIQDPNSTSIYNMAEIYEISEVVKKLQDTWPLER